MMPTLGHSTWRFYRRVIERIKYPRLSVYVTFVSDHRIHTVDERAAAHATVDAWLARR